MIPNPPSAKKNNSSEQVGAPLGKIIGGAILTIIALFLLPFCFIFPTFGAIVVILIFVCWLGSSSDSLFGASADDVRRIVREERQRGYYQQPKADHGIGWYVLGCILALAAVVLLFCAQSKPNATPEVHLDKVDVRRALPVNPKLVVPNPTRPGLTPSFEERAKHPGWYQIV
jgi:hypothetical protein